MGKDLLKCLEFSFASADQVKAKALQPFHTAVVVAVSNTPLPLVRYIALMYMAQFYRYNCFPVQSVLLFVFKPAAKNISIIL